MEYWINHLSTNLLTIDLLTTNLLTTKLLTKIHRLVGQPLILEPRLDLTLLKSMLRHLWKD